MSTPWPCWPLSLVRLTELLMNKVCAPDFAYGAGSFLEHVFRHPGMLLSGSLGLFGQCSHKLHSLSLSLVGLVLDMMGTFSN